MAENIQILDEKTFDEALTGAEKPLLVDFWADWCGPCKALAPILEEIADEQDEISVAKLNVDDAPAIAQRFNVMSIPTLILFRDGEAAEKVVGAQSKQELLSSFGLSS